MKMDPRNSSVPSLPPRMEPLMTTDDHFDPCDFLNPKTTFAILVLPGSVCHLTGFLYTCNLRIPKFYIHRAVFCSDGNGGQVAC